MSLLAFDQQFSQYEFIAGVDEAGRGPLAGPVVAAAVIFPKTFTQDLGINDSKKLSAKKRAELKPLIEQNAIAVGVGIVHHQEIDVLNIYQASLKAMQLAVAQLQPPPDFLLVDGRAVPQVSCPAQAVVKGDGKSLCVAAASIIAKVTRDEMMVALHAQFPQYEFAQHKGYPTKLHMHRIAQYGLSPVHRRSFRPKQLEYLYE